MTHDLHYGITEQGKAGKHRMDDARDLFNAVRWRGAMYMAGYAVECLLKAKLMRMFECRHLRELEDYLQEKGLLSDRGTVFTHQLEVLLRLAQGRDRLRQNITLWPQFNIVNRWVPAWRYNPDLSNSQTADEFLIAVEENTKWIEHNI